MNLIFATGNENKVREMRKILPKTIEVRSLAEIGFTDEIPETSDTIEGNSLLKARFLKEVLHKNGFAEDTGLEVEALNGEPGIYSARYAGPDKNADDNMDLVLKKLEGKLNRKAQFKTVITLIIDEDVHQFEGTLKGRIGLEKKGSNGFGYDPVFYLADGRSLAELSADEKAGISHRALAFRRLLEFLQIKYI